MFKTILLLGLAAVAYGQVLRISPAVIGSSGAGQLQVIQLGQGGSVSPFRAQSNRLVAQPIRIQQARPIQVAQAQPQLIRLVQVRPQPQPIRIVQAQPQIVRVAQAQPQIVRQSAPLRRQSEDESPKPFSFAFDSEDEFGTKLGRQESADASGTVTGQYTLSDASGISRIVKYIADDNGFRADVITNEPGTLTSEPADVKIQSSSQ